MKNIRKKIIIGFGGGLILGGMVFYICQSFYGYWQYKKQLRQNIVYWKSIAGEYPNYPDCWVKLAINWHNLGKEKFARLAIKKAQRLDPINQEYELFKNLY